MKTLFGILLLISLTGCGRDWHTEYYLDCVDREVVVEWKHFDDPYEGNLYTYRINGVQKSVKKVDCSLKRTRVYVPTNEYEKFKEVE